MFTSSIDMAFIETQFAIIWDYKAVYIQLFIVCGTFFLGY